MIVVFGISVAQLFARIKSRGCLQFNIALIANIILHLLVYQSTRKTFKYFDSG